MFTGFRSRRGLTICDLARQTGIAEEKIIAWERRRGQPTKAELQDIATAFNASVFELLKPALPTREAASASSGPPPPSAVSIWDADKQKRWGALPHAIWGYLRLQLSPDATPRWYPLSSVQACSISRQIERSGHEATVVALTLNNRCVLFAPQRIHSASLVDKAAAVAATDFHATWDAEGHPPELYRALRAWAQNDIIERFGTSNDLTSRVHDILRKGTTYTRKKINALVDHTIVHNRDGTTIRFSATAVCIQIGVRSVLAGAQAVYLAEYQGYEEWLIELADTLAIDIPATDVGLVSSAQPAKGGG